MARKNCSDTSTVGKAATVLACFCVLAVTPRSWGQPMPQAEGKAEGEWFAASRANDVAQPPGAVDSVGGCEDFTVTAPYVSPFRFTCGAGHDCDLAGLDWDDHIYKVTIPAAGTWRFSLCGSFYDTRLAVGRSCCSADVGSSDDKEWCGFQSEVNAENIPAGVYYVTVDGYDRFCGEYYLNIVCEFCPDCGDGVCNYDETCGNCPEDCGTCTGCADFRPVTAPYISPRKNTCGAANDCDLPYSDGADHIHEVTIPYAGTWRFSICDADYDTKLMVGTSCCTDEVGYDDACAITAALSPGTYYVMVDGFSGFCGNYTLEITPQESGACCIEDPLCPNPGVCGTHLSCMDNEECACAIVAEGGGRCVLDAFCRDLQPCPNGTVDCPPGQFCYVQTCCRAPVCQMDCEGEAPPRPIPPCDFCWIGTEFEDNCPLGWLGGNRVCDCGCQWEDPDCVDPRSASIDLERPSRLLGHTERVAATGDEPNCMVDVWAICEPPGGEFLGPGTSCAAPNVCLATGCEFAAADPTFPPNCAIDARQPAEPNGDHLAGWDSMTINFASECTPGLDDLSILQTPEGPTPIVIVSVDQLDAYTMGVNFSRKISLQRWTCVIFAGQEFCIGHLPGDANGDGTSGLGDVYEMLDNLNGRREPPMAMWQCDLDRSGFCKPADILRAVDLLNGASTYAPWNGEVIQVCPSQ